MWMSAVNRTGGLNPTAPGIKSFLGPPLIDRILRSGPPSRDRTVHSVPPIILRNNPAQEEIKGPHCRIVLLEHVAAFKETIYDKFRKCPGIYKIYASDLL